MSAAASRVTPRWLALREPADAEARSRDLVEHLERALPRNGRRVIHDLGCGTGSMGRWLAPQLTGPQHWVLHDRDGDLLALAAAGVPGLSADDAPVTVETRHTDLAGLSPRDLAGAGAIAASALLDLLTEDELDRLARTSVAVGCPILLTLSVTGRVEITPAEPLDASVAAAFDAHQRRGRLLGPGAVAFAVDVFRSLGAEVLVRASAWRLGGADSGLFAEWFTGWVGAACEQETELDARCEPYARLRLQQAGTGALTVTVGHADMLILP